MSERLILSWPMTAAIVYGGVDDYNAGYWDDEEGDAAIDWGEFEADYTVLDNRFLSDPKESWYQGINFAAIIERKSDGQKFGYGYWEDISKHGEAYAEPNGYDYGAGDQDAVWFPVEPFVVTGYEIITDKKEDA